MAEIYCMTINQATIALRESEKEERRHAIMMATAFHAPGKLKPLEEKVSEDSSDQKGLWKSLMAKLNPGMLKDIQMAEAAKAFLKVQKDG